MIFLIFKLRGVISVPVSKMKKFQIKLNHDIKKPIDKHAKG